ncbi:MAG: M14 family metallocarboxypeptidase [Burkholderiales bacterium]
MAQHAAAGRRGWANAVARGALALAWLAGCASVLPPGATRPEVEPPYSAAVAARFPAPAVRYDTPGLAVGRERYTSDDELRAWLDDLVRADGHDGTRIVRLEAGRSQQGVPLQVLHLSRGAGRPVVLLTGQQHGDEPAGAEALLVVARELARGHLGSVLDRIDVAVLPRANPDGTAWNTRVAADGIDINRDHLLLRTPEARALARLMREWAPIVVVDLHEHTVVGRYLEKFDAVQRNDLLLQYAMTANYPESLAQASQRWFIEPMRQALTREGLTHEWYYTNPTTPGDLRLSMGGLQPDTARNVNGLKQTVSILLESRGVGIGRAHLQRRVHSHVVAVRAVLDSAAEHAQDLMALQRGAGSAVAAAACLGDVVVLQAATAQQRELVMLDPETGADKAVSVAWDSALQPRVLRTRERPCGYWIGAEGALAVQRLRDLGVQVQRFASDAPLQAEGWRELSRVETARPDVRGTVADAAQTVIGIRVALAPHAATAPAGSWYVALDQPLANLAVAALEPDTPSSYFANRLLPSLDAALRVRSPPAAAWSAP